MHRTLHICFRSLTLMLAMALAPLAARAERVALVIGNAAYPTAPLVNPKNDSRDMAELLRRAGFQVVLHQDTDLQQLSRAVAEFGATIRRPEVKFGLFYYAGHGVQLEWRNYLVPVSAKVQRAEDVPAETVDISALLRYMNQAKGRNFLVILDACRDDPFAGQYRPLAKGLSQFDAPVGSLLAYATAPGQVAIDGEGANGLYTGNLLRELAQPGVRVEDAFKRVRLSVRLASRGMQVPWESTSLEEEVYLFPTERRKLSEAEQDALFEREVAAWMRVKSSNDPMAVAAFLREYPSGVASELAQARLSRLLFAQGQARATPPTVVAAADTRQTGPDPLAAAREAADREAAERARQAERERAEAHERREAAARAEREAAERAAVERARLEQLQREAEARMAAERAEQERLAALAREREAAEAALRQQALREQQAREAAERLERERQLAETRRREAERAEQERLAALAREREAAEAALRQQALREQQAREAAERLERERQLAETRRREAERAEQERLAALAREREAAEAALRQQALREQQARAAAEQAEQDRRDAQARREAAVASASPNVQAIQLPATPFSRGYFEHLREYRVGDRFEYRVIDQLTKLETPLVYRVSRVDVEGDRVEYNDGQYVSDLMGNTTTNPRGGFSTPRQFYPAELYVGKRWRTEFKQSRPGGIVYTFRYDVRVVGRETVTVPAGTFEAFKIEARGFNVQRGARLERNIWVAPGVAADIAHEILVRLSSGTIEQYDRQELLSIQAAR